MTPNDSPPFDAAALHADALVADAASFFCTGWDADLETSGVNSLNIMAPWPGDDFEQALRRVEAYYDLVAAEPRLRLVANVEDVRDAARHEQVGLVLGTQNLKLIDDRLSRLESMARLGFRYVQLTYNARNFIGDGCAEPTDAGLSRFGREVVRTVPQVGLVMDLTHAGPRTALEAARLATAPVMVSHANPRGLFDNPRNVSDDVIRAVASSGGVIGCTLPSPFNWGGEDRLPTLADFVRAIEYVIDLVGDDHVAIGSDLVATPGAYPPELSRTLRGDLFTISGAFYGRYGTEKHVRKVQGIEELRDYPSITAALLEHGHAPDRVRKILGGNLLRVYEACWAPVADPTT